MSGTRRVIPWDRRDKAVLARRFPVSGLLVLLEKARKVMGSDHVLVSEGSGGCPTASVNPDGFWDLVEYLSWHRVAVQYDYHDSCFTVRFPHLTLAAAQGLLDAWTGSRSERAASNGPARRKTEMRSEVLIG